MYSCGTIRLLLMACSGTPDDTGDLSHAICQAISGDSNITGKECSPPVNGIKGCSNSVIEFKVD